MSVKVAYTKIQLNKSALRALQSRTKAELQSWAVKVLREKVTPVTPLDTGRLRRDADVSVEAGENVKVIWYYTLPYAPVVERSWYGKAVPKTPGTRAPFLEPSIRRAVKETVREPISKSFKE